MTRHADSPLLKALDHASALAAKEYRATRQTLPPYPGTRGGVRGGTLPPPPDTAPTPGDVLMSQLADANASVQAQIAALRSWLGDHPDLLRLLDAGMSQEFQAMEQRVNRKNVVYNAVFTVIGAVLGLLLPVLIGGMPYLLALIGR